MTMRQEKKRTSIVLSSNAETRPRNLEALHFSCILRNRFVRSRGFADLSCGSARLGIVLDLYTAFHPPYALPRICQLARRHVKVQKGSAEYASFPWY